LFDESAKLLWVNVISKGLNLEFSYEYHSKRKIEPGTSFPIISAPSRELGATESKMRLSFWKAAFIASAVSAYNDKRCDCEEVIVDSSTSIIDPQNTTLSTTLLALTPTLTPVYSEETEEYVYSTTVTACMMSATRSTPIWGPWFNTTGIIPFQAPTPTGSIFATASVSQLTPFVTSPSMFSSGSRSRSWDMIENLCWIGLTAFLTQFGI
jgi:hypothetical protein